MKSKKSSSLDHAGFSSYGFMLPGMIIYLSVIVIPVFYSLYISLFDWNGLGDMTFVGLNNYANMFSDDVFLKSLSHTFLWIILVLVFNTCVSLGFAVMLTKNYRGRTIFRGIYYMPSVISLIATAIIWRWIYNAQYGFINQLAQSMGSSWQQTWISQPGTVIYAVFAAALWQGVGTTMILFIAGLQSVPTDCIEASVIDGANSIQRFFHVTVPLMKETFVMVIATEVIAAMKVYDVIAGLTDGGPNNASQMLATYMYSNTFQYAKVGYGTAIACFMLIVMLVVIIPYVKFTAKE